MEEKRSGRKVGSRVTRLSSISGKKNREPISWRKLEKKRDDEGNERKKYYRIVRSSRERRGKREVKNLPTSFFLLSFRNPQSLTKP